MLKVVLKAIRQLRIFYLRLGLLLTPESKTFIRYGVPAKHRFAFPNKQNIKDKGWVCVVDKGISTLSGENIDNDGGLLVQCSFAYLEEQLENQSRDIDRIGWDKRKPKIKKQTGAVVTLTMQLAYQKNYFHWLFDVLPRLSLVRSAVCKLDYVYCHNEMAFQKDSLAALGLQQREILSAHDDSFLQADQLIVPSVVNAFRGVPLWCIDFLRAELMPKLIDVDFKSPSKKLFISRRDASHRCAVNEEELQAKLDAAGFVKIVASDCSLKEQINLFAQADVIVGIHGAAMANLVFCRPQTKVLEIVPPSFDWSLFGDIAELCNLEFKKVAASIQTETIDNPFGYQKSDFAVDMEHINSSLIWAIE